MLKRWGATPKNVLSWIARGDGQGEGKNYRPFLHVRDVPSSGRSAMVLCLKTGRTHHYLSDLEYFHHILSEYEPSVEDIREQYALLPWEETQEIAKRLGIRHPVYPGTKTPLVMTSDIVLTIRRTGLLGYGVVCVKPSSMTDPQNPRTRRVLEKLLVEKTYWEQRGIPWRLSTEKDIPMTRVRNLDMLRTSLVSTELDWLLQYMSVFIELFNRSWTSEYTLSEIIDRVSNLIGLDRNGCFALFGRAVWLSRLPVDLDTEVIAHDYPLLRKL